MEHAADARPAGRRQAQRRLVPSSDACVAVGAQGLAIAETWDGTSWKLQSVPARAGATSSALNGVSCTAAPRCVAVGWYYDGSTSQPLIERLS